MQDEMEQQRALVWRGECRIADQFMAYESQPVVLRDEESGKYWACLQVFKFAIVLGAWEMQGAFDTLDEAREAAQQMQRNFAPDPLAEERAVALAAAGAGEVAA